MDNSTDLVSLFALVSRRLRWLAGSAVACLLLSFGALKLMPSRYTAHASFVPSGPSESQLQGLASSLGGIAATLGLSGLSSGQASSPFYAQLLQSDAILLRVLDSVPDSTARGYLNYVQINHLKAKTPLMLRDLALDHLRSHLEIRIDPRTQVVTAEFTSVNPRLSVWVLQRLLDELNQFNISTLQTGAREKAQFIQERVTAMRGEVAAAQANLQDFLVANRQYQESPALTFRRAQLQQAYDSKQQTLTTLLSSLEQARIDAYRDMPVVTVLDHPLLPARPSGPKRVLLSIEITMLWLGCAVLWIIGRAVLAAGAAQRPEEAASIREQWGALARPFRVRRRSA